VPNIKSEEKNNEYIGLNRGVLLPGAPQKNPRNFIPGV